MIDDLFAVVQLWIEAGKQVILGIDASKDVRTGSHKGTDGDWVDQSYH
jgi:hypothetical protein